MITSLIVYIGLMLLMTAFSRPAGQSGLRKYTGVIIASVLYAVIFGIRYNVGTDFPMYLRGYENTLDNVGGWEAARWEIGYQWIFLFPARIGLPYPFGFGVIAFIQCFLLYVGLRRQPEAWKFLPVTLMLSWIWLSYANIMRHMVAFSIFVAALPYLADRKYLKFIACILVAMLFHKSAAVIFPLVIVYHYRKVLFTNIFIEYVMLGVAVTLMNVNVVQQVFQSLTGILVLFNYDFYEDTKYAEFDYVKNTFNIGFLTILILCIFNIYFSNRLKRFYKSRAISIMYDMYFIGVFLRFAFVKMFLIQRLNYYFFSFEFIISALLMEYFYETKQKRNLIFLILLYVALFLGRLKGASNFDAVYQTFLNR